MESGAFPGTPRHQALLQAIVAHYAGDTRILAVSLFGSLARGNWHPLSDLDLDVVLADGVTVDPIAETQQLCRSLQGIGERAALIVPDGADAVDVVLLSLAQFSIRYHPLDDTSPNIVDSLMVLSGPLDAPTIRQAGLARRRDEYPALTTLVDRALRYVLEVEVAVERRRFWLAVELLHRVRSLLMELYVDARGGGRSASFEAEASPELQARFRAMLPGYNLSSVQQALAAFFDLSEQDWATLSDGKADLSDLQRELLHKLRQQ